MFNAWFIIKNDCLYDEDYLHGTPWSNCGNLWVGNLTRDGAQIITSNYVSVCQLNTGKLNVMI